MCSALAWRATSSGRVLPDVFLPSESSTITPGSRRVPLPSRLATGVRTASMPRRSASPIAGPPPAPAPLRVAPAGGEPVERVVDRAALGGRRDGLLGVVGERHQAEPQLVREL